MLTKQKLASDRSDGSACASAHADGRRHSALPHVCTANRGTGSHASTLLASSVHVSSSARQPMRSADHDSHTVPFQPAAKLLHVTSVSHCCTHSFVAGERSSHAPHGTNGQRSSAWQQCGSLGATSRHDEKQFCSSGCTTCASHCAVADT